MVFKDLLGAPRSTAVGVHLVSGLLVAALVLVATTDERILTYVALGGAGAVAVFSVLGPERTGVLVLIAAYFTAPFYKGTAPNEASLATGTDGLLFLGLLLLLPRILRGRLRMPIIYWAGIALVLTAGVVASGAAADPRESFTSLAFWMVVMLGLPVAFAMWGPSMVVIDLLATSYIAGQIFSFAVGWAKGNIAQDRHAGLSTHPNYFAQASMLSIALLIYLAYRYFGKSFWLSVAWVAAAGACSAGVILSGSRAATLVVAVLILMVPIVERSAFTGLLMALCGALFVAGLPILADIAGEGSSIDRLTGGGGAQFSNSERERGLRAGLDLFFEHPLRGTGLITDNLYTIHNNYLEVAVAIGIFGFAGYLLVLYVFARPILGKGDTRRLTYCVWGYIGFGATVPSLYDRSVWAVVVLSTVPVLQYWHRRVHGAPDEPNDPDGSMGEFRSATGTKPGTLSAASTASRKS